MIALKQTLSICNPTISQYTTLTTISKPQEQIKLTRTKINAHHGALINTLKHNNIHHITPTTD